MSHDLRIRGILHFETLKNSTHNYAVVNAYLVSGTTAIVESDEKKPPSQNWRARFVALSSFVAQLSIRNFLLFWQIRWYLWPRPVDHMMALQKVIQWSGRQTKCLRESTSSCFRPQCHQSSNNTVEHLFRSAPTPVLKFRNLRGLLEPKNEFINFL